MINRSNQEQIIDIEHVEIASANKAGVKLFMARADKIHPLASGNKFYKLRPHLEHAKANGIKQLVSFGGAYSNHVHALAMMANHYGFQSVGIIRGEPEYAANPTLTAAKSAGMKLEFVTRKEYQLRNDKNYLADLILRYPQALIIPEGGSSQLAITGCSELTKDINAQQISDILTIASGTGASIAGLVCGLKESQQAISYAVLKDQSLAGRISSFIDKEIIDKGSIGNEIIKQSKYTIEQADYGGYAKLDDSHLTFIFEWLEQTGILLDPIYTSKMCRRLIEQISSGQFKQGASITMVHSGGLQGWYGMQQKVIKLAGDSSWKRIQSHLDSV